MFTVGLTVMISLVGLEDAASSQSLTPHNLSPFAKVPAHNLLRVRLAGTFSNLADVQPTVNEGKISC